MTNSLPIGGMLLGDILRVRLPQRVPPGHEQEAMRPAVVVGMPDILGRPRYPLVLVAPMTTHRRQSWAMASPDLYPRVPARTGGLRVDSLVLLDQICALDPARIDGYLGTLPTAVYESILARLLRMLRRP